jgi:hypothetical protein
MRRLLENWDAWSIVGREYLTEEQAVGFYNAGDRRAGDGRGRL